jgi:tetraacyldisaccharide 4'-kinase
LPDTAGEEKNGAEEASEIDVEKHSPVHLNIPSEPAPHLGVRMSMTKEALTNFKQRNVCETGAMTVREKALRLMHPALAPFSVLYGAGVFLRLSASRRLPKASLPGFVVSIGNVTVGGTGKTPAACLIAEWGHREGYRVAVLSRGYRGRYREEVLVVSDGKEVMAGPLKAGDEPYLMAKRLPGVPVLVSKKRHLAGAQARARFGTNFFVLDDGFQHVSLARDLNLVLIDATNPFGNGHLLPWGPLREPVGQLERADALIITRSQEAGSRSDLGLRLGRRFPSKAVFYSAHTPAEIVFPYGGETQGPDFLKGKRAIAFAGIGQPHAFRDTLLRLGAELLLFKGFRDHHRFRRQEIQALIRERERLEADYLLTTEKDWVRVENLGLHDPQLAYLRINFSFLSGIEPFFGMIKDRIGQAGSA